MLTSLDIISLFKTARGSYSLIVCLPTDDDMFCLREAILAIIYSISLGADAGCLSRLILSDAAYKRSLVTSVGFDRLSGAFKSYDPNIADDAKDGIRKKR